MFNLGIWEIAVLALIALVVVGPEKLPELARNIGRFLNEVKRTTNDFTQNINEAIDEKKFHQDEAALQGEDGEPLLEDSLESEKDV